MLCRGIEKYADNLETVQSFHWGPLLQNRGPLGSAPQVQVLLESLSQGRLREKQTAYV